MKSIRSDKPAKSKDALFYERRIEIDFPEFGFKNIKRLGRLNYSRAHYPLAMHTHEKEMEICYIAKGRQIYVVGGKEYYILGGDVYITHPNELHGSGKNPEEKSILYWLLIDMSDTENFLGYPGEEGKELLSGLKGIQKRCFRGNGNLKAILDRIISIYYRSEPYSKILIRNLITEYIINIIQLERENCGYSLSPEIKSILDVIESELSSDLDLTELAAKINLSVSRFKQKFKEEVGIPPKEYILRKKVEKSQEMLKTTELSVTDIAYELNFSSSQYFSTVFKRITGKSPAQSRA